MNFGSSHCIPIVPFLYNFLGPSLELLVFRALDNMVVAGFRRRETMLGLSLITGMLILFTLIKSPPRSALQSLSNYVPSSLLPPTFAQKAKQTTLEILAQLYEDERIANLLEYDQGEAEALVHTPPGALSPNFDDYLERLGSFVDTYFNHSEYHEPLSRSLSRMVTARPPVVEGDLRRHVFAFEKDGRDGVPEEFQYWDRRLGEFGWSIEVGDDEQMEEWFADIVEVDGEAKKKMDREEVEQTGQARWEHMWRGIGVPVLKSDLLRYLMLLTRGGLYTDSDTSVLSDPNLWGTHAHDYTPRGLAAIQRAMRHLDPDHPSSGHLDAMRDGQALSPIPKPYTTSEKLAKGDQDFEEQDEEAADALAAAASKEGGRTHVDLDLAINPNGDIRKGINNKRVALVVAVEYDVHHDRQDPREAYTRDFQIVQWTMLAKPFHPVYIDVLQTAMEKIMNRREAGDDHESWQTVVSRSVSLNAPND